MQLCTKKSAVNGRTCSAMVPPPSPSLQWSSFFNHTGLVRYIFRKSAGSLQRSPGCLARPVACKDKRIFPDIALQITTILSSAT